MKNIFSIIILSVVLAAVSLSIAGLSADVASVNFYETFKNASSEDQKLFAELLKRQKHFVYSESVLKGLLGQCLTIDDCNFDSNGM